MGIDKAIKQTVFQFTRTAKFTFEEFTELDSLLKSDERLLAMAIKFSIEHTESPNGINMTEWVERELSSLFNQLKK